MFRGQFINKLTKYAKDDSRIHILTADLGFKLFDGFRNECPQQFLNVGVAEANMVSVAAGMALCGRNVFVYSMVPFVTSRALDQIRVDVSGHNVSVKLVGVGAGVGYGLEGMTHFALEDIGLLRAFPNMKIVCPADEWELDQLLPQVISSPTPVYLRLIKGAAEALHQNPHATLNLGDGVCVRQGKDVAILSYGNSVVKGVEAAIKLEKSHGQNASVFSFPTLKPFDKNLLAEIIKTHSRVFTIEEHSVVGGIGTIVSEALLELGFKGSFKKIAFPDQLPNVIGHGPYLCDWAGVTSENLYQKIIEGQL